MTQPYDKITVEMHARYYGLSPFNLVRIIRGRSEPQDSPQSSVYTRAAAYLRAWIDQRALVSEAEAALYPYYQEYSIPGQPGAHQERRGVVHELPFG